MSGFNRECPPTEPILGILPGLRHPVVTKLDGNVPDAGDPVARPLFNVLAVVEKFESDHIRAHEGMQIARGKRKLRGKQPKLSRAPEKRVTSP